MHPAPAVGPGGLPQGDPWSPLAQLALAFFLAPAFAQLRRMVPLSAHYLYVDDRSSFVASRLEVDMVQAVWDRLENATRMRNNRGKVQIWDRQNLAECGVVLGAVLGREDAALHDNEVVRMQSCERTAERLGCLPVALKLRARVAASMITPKAVWGQVITGF